MLPVPSGIVIVVDLRSGNLMIVMRSERTVLNGEQKLHDGIKSESQNIVS